MKTSTWHGFRFVRWVDPYNRHVWWSCRDRKRHGVRVREELFLYPGTLRAAKQRLVKLLLSQAERLEEEAHMKRLTIQQLDPVARVS